MLEVFLMQIRLINTMNCPIVLPLLLLHYIKSCRKEEKTYDIDFNCYLEGECHGKLGA